MSCASNHVAKPEPQHPDYAPAKPERVRINGVECVEMDADKWLGMLRDSAWWANNGQGRGK